MTTSFWQHIIDADMFLVHIMPVKGFQTLVMNPTSLLQQSLVNAVPHCMMLHWYSLLSGREFQILTKIWLHFWWHIIDVWHLPSVYVACKGLSDLSNGPNKPTATIIGEYGASCHHGALVFTLVRASISDSDQNLATFWMTHHWCLASSQCVCSL